MKIYFVRHGNAHHNDLYNKIGEKAYFDKSVEDAELTILGNEQSKQTGKLLNSINFTEYYSSPLTRCIQTLDNIINYNIKICLDDRLLEPQGFHICNKRKDKLNLNLNIKKYNKSFCLENIKNNYLFELELNNQINNRIINFIEELKLKHKNTNNNILVVTHHDWLNHFYKLYFNTNMSFQNCEYKIVEF